MIYTPMRKAAYCNPTASEPGEICYSIGLLLIVNTVLTCGFEPGYEIKRVTRIDDRNNKGYRDIQHSLVSGCVLDIDMEYG